MATILIKGGCKKSKKGPGQICVQGHTSWIFGSPCAWLHPDLAAAGCMATSMIPSCCEPHLRASTRTLLASGQENGEERREIAWVSQLDETSYFFKFKDFSAN
jgi:hypothetical protein